MKKPMGRYAYSVTVGEKGQIVIPKQLRDVFEIEPGDTLILLADRKRGIAIPPKSAFSEIRKKVFGQEEDDNAEDDE